MKKAMKALFVSFFLILIVSDSFAAENKNKAEINTVENYVAVRCISPSGSVIKGL